MCSSSPPDISAAVLLSLGSNLGNREQNLQGALAGLCKRGAQVVTCSSVYRTDPLYVRNQPDFLNIACRVQTALSPEELLESCLRIEQSLGRKRRVDKGPREIDIDIVFFGQELIETDNLVVPHPLLYERNFVLVPLAEIAPDFPDPRTGLTVLQLRERCQDVSRLERVGGLVQA